MDQVTRLFRSREVEITRMLATPPARAFELWTKPEHLVRWWGPKDEEGRDFTVPHCELDLRLGGHWRIVLRAPNGREYRHGGVFRAIEPPNRLVLSHAWEEDGRRGELTMIEVIFDAVGSGTRMTFYQGEFASAEASDSHDQGWRECFDKLEAFVCHN